MPVLMRNVGEKLKTGQDIEGTVLRIKGAQVSIDVSDSSRPLSSRAREA